VGAHLNVAPALNSFGIGRARTWHRLQRGLDLLTDTLDDLQVGAGYLHAHRALDPGRQHVDPVTDGLYPEIGETGDVQSRIHLADQLLLSHVARPFGRRLGFDAGLEHFRSRSV